MGALMDGGLSASTLQPRTGNRILDLLGGQAATLFPCLEPCTARAELAPGFVVFPAPGTVLARVLVLADGRTAQVALIGGHGLWTNATPDYSMAEDRAQALVPGNAWRAPAPLLAPAMARSEALRQAMAAQDRQLLQRAWFGIACAALHQVEQRVAHWLLAVDATAAQGAAAPEDLPVTQAVLAALLGLRRTTVTRAMATLEERGLIRHRRGRVTLLDRSRLQATACECHGRSQTRAGAL
jgi:Crp-like helix-turn-helix domain